MILFVDKDSLLRKEMNHVCEHKIVGFRKLLRLARPNVSASGEKIF